jgi:hypothetical protein
MTAPVDETMMNSLVDWISEGKCILFLGAGVHFRAPYPSSWSYPGNQRPPLGRAFSKYLAKKSNFAKGFPKENVTNLQRVSLHYEIQYSRFELIEEVKNAVFNKKRPSPILRALAELNFPMVITTNYDQLFEEALRELGKRPRVSIYSPDETLETVEYEDEGTPTVESPFVVKVHGDIGSPESLVISDEDYIQFVVRMGHKPPYNPIPMTFRSHFVKWPTLFIGYSLMDYNLRLLFITLRWKVDKSRFPPTYSVDRSPDPLILDVWQNQRKFVKFIAQDVWTFVPTLYRKIKGVEMPR